jgi:hypothetical protein
MGLLGRLFGARRAGRPVLDRGPPPAALSAGAESFHARPPSFSLVFFEGDVREAIPSLLAGCGYRLTGGVSERVVAADLYGSMQRWSGRGRLVVRKAVYPVPGFTVLADPELVVTTDDEALEDFCRANRIGAIAALWERVSKTVLLHEVGPDGSRRRSFWTEGRPEAGQAPHPELAARPDADGLQAALARLGIPLRSVWGEVEATVLELEP